MTIVQNRKKWLLLFCNTTKISPIIKEEYVCMYNYTDIGLSFFFFFFCNDLSEKPWLVATKPQPVPAKASPMGWERGVQLM